MKHTKRILAMLLTVLMLVSVVPLGMMNASASLSPANLGIIYNANGGKGEMRGTTYWANMRYSGEIQPNVARDSNNWPETLVLKQNEFTREGYIFCGWNANRGSDNTWYVSGKGWKTEDEISKEKLTKKIYQSGVEYKLNGSWKNSKIFDKNGKQQKTEAFTFYAVWALPAFTVSLKAVDHLETASARVHLVAKNPYSLPVSARGVQVRKKGASDWAKTYSEDISKKDYNKNTQITGYFDIGSGKEVNYALSPNTTYEYRCFVSCYGFSSYSKISTFTTKPDNKPTVTLRPVDHIETNAATVHLTAKNPGKLLVTARGVQVKKKGASSWAKTYSEDLSKKTYNKDTEITGYFDIGSGKEVNYALSAGTTYEYRCFVTSGGKNYYSSVSTFTTKPDNKPTVTLRPVDHIETNAATVHLTAKNPGKLLVTARGVQVKKKGASSWAKTYSEDLSKKTYNKDTEITGYFDIGSGKEVNYALSAGTTYEYRCFVTSGGTNYYSSVSTFTTLPAQTSNADPYFAKVWASGISDTNATINAEFSSLTSVKSTGFYFGTSASSLKKITKKLDGKADSAGKVKKIYFGLNDWYGKLTPGTTYYYKIFYTNSSGKECASNVYSFITTGTTTYKFTIKYDANGGKGTMASTTVAKDTDFILAKNQFAKEGATFAGWTVKRSSDNKWYVPDEGWKTAKEITDNGWNKKVYQSDTAYRFNAGWINGTKTSDTYIFYVVWKECGHKWNEGVVTKEPTTSATGVMTYTCELCGKTKTEKIPKISAYQIKFNANGGKGTMAAMRVEEEEDFRLPENQFTKVGYVFAGWTVKRSSDNKWYVPDEGWKTTKEIKENGWSKKVYESDVAYRFNASWINGTKTSDTYTFYAVWEACEHVWDDGVVTKEPTTSATGVMTYTCEICSKTKTEKIPKISTYQIKFNANGGKGSFAGMKVEKEEPFTLPENPFTKAGYTFVGWTVKRSSDGRWLVEEDEWQTNNEIKETGDEKLIFDEDVDLELDDEWINGSKATDTYTFYAVWEKDQ